MNTADPVRNYTVLIPSGSGATMTDTNFDYRYYRLVVTGAYNTTTTVTLNGVAGIVLVAGTVLDIPIFQCAVTAGEDVVLFGTQHVKEIFGD